MTFFTTTTVVFCLLFSSQFLLTSSKQSSQSSHSVSLEDVISLQPTQQESSVCRSLKTKLRPFRFQFGINTSTTIERVDFVESYPFSFTIALKCEVLHTSHSPEEDSESDPCFGYQVGTSIRSKQDFLSFQENHGGATTDFLDPRCYYSETKCHTSFCSDTHLEFLASTKYTNYGNDGNTYDPLIQTSYLRDVRFQVGVDQDHDAMLHLHTNGPIKNYFSKIVIYGPTEYMNSKFEFEFQDDRHSFSTRIECCKTMILDDIIGWDDYDYGDHAEVRLNPVLGDGGGREIGYIEVELVWRLWKKYFFFFVVIVGGGFLLIFVYLVSIGVWRNPLFPRGRKMEYDREGIEDDEESDNFDEGGGMDFDKGGGEEVIEIRLEDLSGEEESDGEGKEEI